MKNMILLSMGAILLVSIAGCTIAGGETSNVQSILGATTDFEKTYQTVQELNENSDFGEYELLQKTKNEALDGIYEPGNPEHFIDSDSSGEKMMEGTYSPYPASSGIRYLTQLVIYSPEFHVYGVQVGDNIDVAQNKLYGQGYNKEQKGSWGTGAVLNNVDIDLHTKNNDGIVTKIVITAYDPTRPKVDGAY